MAKRGCPAGEDKLTQAVRSTIAAYDMLESGEAVLVALSGGADSVALLLCLRALGYTVSACHLHHGLRGAEADRDEAFCRALCAQLDVPLITQRADAQAHAKKMRESIETAARDLRYAFFAKAAKQWGIAKIATAHTASDNLETMLFHLARGTGLDGLCGIPPVRGAIVRPLIACTRAQVEDFLHLKGQGFVTDSSNASDDFTRNRIRREMIPVLRALNPRAEQAAADLSARLRHDAAFLHEQAKALAAEAAQEEGWVAAVLRQAPSAIRTRALRLICAEKGIPMRDFTARHIAALEDLLLSGNPSAQVHLPGGFIARREYGQICFLAKESIKNVPFPAQIPIQIPFFGTLGIGFSQVRIRHAEKEQLFYKSLNTFWVDCDTIDLKTLVLRTRRAGDRLRLDGGSKTLKKLMIDQKIPRSRRDRLTVVADRDGLIAVQDIGADISRRPQGAGIYEIRFEG